MDSKLFPLLIGLMLAVLSIGCSQGPGFDPVNTSIPIQSGIIGESVNNAGSSNHYLWGLWQCDIDPETQAVEIVPMRGAEFHVNVTGRLQAPAPTGLKIVINKFEPANALVDLNLTVTHPYPNSNFRGFDVRGIVLGAGNVISPASDPSIVFTAPDGFRIENADGYTRWWNPTEFGTSGLYGFVPGALGTKVFKPLTTLNPYKYFSDPLGVNDPVTPLVNSTNRGTFSTSPTTQLTRNYIMRFPKIGGNPVWKFQYAVDASWAPPTGGSAIPKPIDDYPVTANCPEAYHITVDSSKSTAYYIDGGNLGGNLVLDIEVFDWGAPSNPKGIDGEIDSIKLESDTLFNGIAMVQVKSSPGTQDTSGIYSITVPNVHPTSTANQEILVTVYSKSPSSYKPPITGPKYPQTAKLAAYTVKNIPILNVNPQENKITVISPNGGEVWDAGSAHDITWSSEGAVGNNVKIEYKIGNDPPIAIIDATPDTGVFPWNPLPSVDSNQVKVLVTSLDDPLIWDDSDEFFTIGIVGTIQVTSPNGGEVVAGDWKWDIKWDSTGPVANVKIELSKDSGDTYPEVIIDSTPNTGVFTWNPTPYINKNTCRIKITDTGNATVHDESDADFSLTQMGDSITVIQPNGGEVIQSGGIYEITWTWTGNIPVVNIYLSTDSGATWPVVIAQFTDCDGSYMLDPVPDIKTTTARIKISTAEIPMTSDSSDADFTIAPI
jgi:hypothetical protein